ncbi:NAD(P)/FAD-dependent oxidoreductase [Halalkalibacter akibai]|uniref:Probable deoxyribodipyrimidine photolyase n=1 Tax=Halalkalibacter akibai (strain ATCC 43226 / DSM 21942 / CIP 109018 / JCM 9157 / 1139) TaxID=1236973 RepID=W4QUD4_HALA3|nr:FAD-dependent oxidoreductase [Halalkalibacter akibai]GAE35507.1 probable deoxyribodipyrimidine photolyase [Halalkalibacter akibai JCM 9157]
MNKPIIIIGGGITGVMAARTLRDQGISNVLIVDKGKSVGGRMATRRVGNGRVDHGAQFFTVRTKHFQAIVNEWEQAGWVSGWFGNNHIRYKSIDGMNDLVKRLSEKLPIKLQSEVNQIESVSRPYYKLTTSLNEQWEAEAVLITTPVPQALQLLQQVELQEQVKKQLEQISYNPCFVLIVTLDTPSSLPDSGFLASGLPEEIDRIVDHQKKGISKTTSLSIYSTGTWAKKQFHLPNEEILHKMLNKIKPYLTGTIVDVQLKRWKYSEATNPVSAPFLIADRNMLIAGEAFLQVNDSAKSTRVESAVLSGIAAGKALAKSMIDR